MNEEFGQFIKDMRKKKSITQKELALKLHISDKAVSKWEVGDSYPDISLLQPIASLFEISIDELLNCHINVKERKKDVTKNLIIFNVAANLVLIIIIVLFLIISLFDGSADGSLSIGILNQKQFSVTALIVLLIISISFVTYNLLQYKKVRSVIKNEEDSSS